MCQHQGEDKDTKQAFYFSGIIIPSWPEYIRCKHALQCGLFSVGQHQYMYTWEWN